jgi:hypothetical protein
LELFNIVINCSSLAWPTSVGGKVSDAGMVINDRGSPLEVGAKTWVQIV